MQLELKTFKFRNHEKFEFYSHSGYTNDVQLFKR